MTKILNQAQAKAVYDAMCAMNKVGATAIMAIPYLNDIKATIATVIMQGGSVMIGTESWSSSRTCRALGSATRPASRHT